MTNYDSPEEAIDSIHELQIINKSLEERINELIDFGQGRYEKVFFDQSVTINAFSNTALYDKTSGSIIVFAGFTADQFQTQHIVSTKFSRMELALNNIAESEQPGSGQVVILGYYPVEGTADILGAINGERNFVSLVTSLNSKCKNIGLMITRLSPNSKFTQQSLDILARLTNRLGRNNSITLTSEKMQPSVICVEIMRKFSQKK